jgi:hypothetical protein
MAMELPLALIKMQRGPGYTSIAEAAGLVPAYVRCRRARPLPPPPAEATRAPLSQLAMRAS